MAILKVSSGGILAQLREKLPGKWKAVRDGFGWRWENDQGRVVRKYAQLNNQYDGDESWHPVYIDNEGKQVGWCGIIFSGNDEAGLV